MNPVRAAMVVDPGDYRWSSYHVHGFGMRTQLWKPHATYLSLGNHALARQEAYLTLMSEKLDSEIITKIRHCANSGLVLGSEKLKAHVDRLTR